MPGCLTVQCPEAIRVVAEVLRLDVAMANAHFRSIGRQDNGVARISDRH